MDLGTLFYVGIVLLVIAIIAYFLGAKGVAGVSAELGKMILIVGVILGIILLLVGTFAAD